MDVVDEPKRKSPDVDEGGKRLREGLLSHGKPGPVVACDSRSESVLEVQSMSR